MRYTIGIHITAKDGTDECNGIVAFGSCGLPFILKESSDVYKRNTTFIMVFNNINSAILQVRALTRACRRDDVTFKKERKSKFIRNFYPLKIDSTNFPFIINELQTKKHITRNEYDEKCEDGTWLGEYIYAKVMDLKPSNLNSMDSNCKSV